MQELIGSLVRELLKKLTPELVKQFVDGGLDRVEDKIRATENKWDDAFVLPIIDSIRSLMGIDDKQYGTDKE